MNEGDYVRTIEAIYDVGQSQRDWLTGVLESARSWLDVGAGLFGYTWQITADANVAFPEFVNAGGPLTSLSGYAASMSSEIGQMTSELLRQNACGLSSQVMTPACQEFYLTPLRALGVVDTLGINGRENDAAGVWIGAYVRRRRALSAADRRRYTRIARHMAAGNRLRKRLSGRTPTDAEAAAILSPAGRVEHALSHAKSVEVRAALRNAVLAIDRARGSERRTDPDGAVRRWRVLADARFSLIDRFETDGRRYVIACENALVAAPERGLTAREGQVVALFRLGVDPKVIAYELGLADATVRVLLGRAAKRLGVRKPRDLRKSKENS